MENYLPKWGLQICSQDVYISSKKNTIENEKLNFLTLRKEFL